VDDANAPRGCIVPRRAGDRKSTIIINRFLNAPRELVFKTWTEREKHKGRDPHGTTAFEAA
jgi:hypothetical protein